MSSELKRPIKVTISDPETGKILSENVLDNDFQIICHGKTYVKSHQRWKKSAQVNIGLDGGIGGEQP